MPRLSPENALRKAEQDRADADRRLKSAQAKIRDQKRKEDTRRKIVIGAMLLELSKSNDGAFKFIQSRLEKMTERDRALFADFEKNEAPETKKGLSINEMFRPLVDATHLRP